jgi:DNA-directed RNA polymerase subunit RPC12/RpoP
MFKKLITPIQLWLLARGQCVGCGATLSKVQSAKLTENTDKITCTCGRIFIYDTQKKTYRRALFSEV